MSLSFVLVIFGLVSLVIGGDLLVRGASRLALAMRVSPLVIGLTVVAYGTSAPELGVSLFASLNGNPELAIANVVGSNIFNIGFILGICSLVAPLVVNSRLIRFDVPILVAVTLVTWLFALDGLFSQLEGVFLVFAALIYTFWVIRASRKEAPDVQKEFANAFAPSSQKGRGLLFNAGLIVAGLVFLVLGAKWLVLGATSVAKIFGVSDAIIGLTIVAAGTSLPEFATSLVATIRGQTDIAIGNIIGSNIFNIMLILGISSGVNPGGLNISNPIQTFDIPIMVFITIICFPMLFTGRKLIRMEGGVLLLGFIAYNIFLWTNRA